MTQLPLSRRSLITGLGALFVAAPAIVRASSIMPVKSFVTGLDIASGYNEFTVTAVGYDQEFDLHWARAECGRLLTVRRWLPGHAEMKVGDLLMIPKSWPDPVENHDAALAA